MSHFAELDENNVVIRVIVAEEDFINSGAVGDPSRWKQTSYNTQGNQHHLGGTPFRKNYAGIGFIYDSDLDAFLPPKPFASWILDEEPGTWKAPIDRPDDGKFYIWNEEIANWEETESVLPPPLEDSV